MITVLFHCGHAQEQKVTYESEDYCETCRDWKLIQDTWRSIWWVTCKRCGLNQSFGYDRKRAEFVAENHIAARGHNVKPQFRTGAPPHVRKILRENKTIKQRETLPLDPPF